MLSSIPSQYMVIGSTVAVIFMGIMAMIVRARSAKKPANARKIIIPPIAMSSGALMFCFEYFRVPWTQVLEAVVVGLIFSTVLIATSKFHIVENDIFLKPSKAFFFILMGLLIVRTVAKVCLSGSFHLGELGGMFWILAFSMIVPWRIAMLVRYKKLERQLHVN
ncbi:cytochrome c biogenesis protein CcdC [Viridibacillus sp. YIM B01967]|uniref:Cytochrome c biogenesis protein CcdC n=1 Tax=Viridibacillus soli TaxID=2798301 RepID=A0ABS1H725_9BACL|nr:cytochrome c biogenesis protein CcdC [Viridibacillus soli]MBK3495214.1 cytochrome c biogenesis protein CcdC [Viridibacillus soli]